MDKNQQHLTNAEKLGCVRKFNPYFSIAETNYKSKRETYIFDYVNFSKITPAFKEAFHIFNFETMFEENITEYINNITEKIKDIQTFGNIIELIDKYTHNFRVRSSKIMQEKVDGKGTERIVQELINN